MRHILPDWDLSPELTAYLRFATNTLGATAGLVLILAGVIVALQLSMILEHAGVAPDELRLLGLVVSGMIWLGAALMTVFLLRVPFRFLNDLFKKVEISLLAEVREGFRVFFLPLTALLQLLLVLLSGKTRITIRGED